MASAPPPQQPPPLEFHNARALLDDLREELRTKRAQLEVRDEAVSHLTNQRDQLRREIFELEDEILDTLVGLISSSLANGTRLPNFIQMVDEEPATNVFTAGQGKGPGA